MLTPSWARRFLLSIQYCKVSSGCVCSCVVIYLQLRVDPWRVFEELTLHGVSGTSVRFSDCVSQVSIVVFPSISYCSQLLCCSTPVLLAIGNVSLWLSARLHPHACLISMILESRHQWSGVKPWKTMPMYIHAKGKDNRPSVPKIRFWQRPKLPASSRSSSKVFILWFKFLVIERSKWLQSCPAENNTDLTAQ